MTRRSLAAACLPIAVALALAAPAVAHDIAAADFGGGGPGGVPNRVDRALGGKVTLRADGLYKVRSKRGYSFTTHGPDYGRDLEAVNSHGGDIDTGDPQRAPSCISNPATDYYQEVLYAYPSYGTNNLAAKEPSIEGIMGRINQVLNEESLASGGPTADYKVRCDGDGTVKVSAFPVPLTAGTNPSFINIVNAAKAAGYTNVRADYSIFYDGTGPSGACGTGYLYGDDRLVAANDNNNATSAGYGATYGGCWFGRTPMHENGHNQGAVQYDAPDSTGNGGHCDEGSDVMCYLDGGNLRQDYPQACSIDPSAIHFDCGWDSYFDSAPEGGEWLATHWNIGSPLNRFISFGGPTADFTFTCTGLSCNFTDASSAASGIASRSWDFGDGASSTATNPSRTYASSAAYDVTLTVTDNDGESKSVTKTVVLNNAFASPQALSGNSLTASGANIGATKEAGEPNHAGFAGGSSVWFRWTAGVTGEAAIDTCGTDFDTLLGVYTGSAVTALTTVASNDDASPSCGSGVRQSAVTFPVTSGTTYRIAVDGYQAATGHITLHLAAGADVAPPQTTIGSGPSGPTNDPNPSFGFSSSEGGSSFECKLETQTLSDCDSPKSFTGVPDGSHTFTVVATDAAGNPDPTPATRSFLVDTVTPETQIAGGPEGTIATPDAVFFFDIAGSDATAISFECRLDGAAFAPCTSPHAVTGLSEGGHTFDVRALDAAGNVDASAASRGFAVDLPEDGDHSAPETTITDHPPAKLKARRKAKVGFAFTASEPGSEFECSLDDAAFAKCSSPWALNAKPGRHRFRVRATDSAGNTDASPASYSFKVKRKRRSH